jgi:hypothetical protein
MTEFGTTSLLALGPAKVSCPPIVLKNSAAGDLRGGVGPELGVRVIGVPPSDGGEGLWSGDELGQLAEVLGDGREVEFVAGAARPAQP